MFVLAGFFSLAVFAHNPDVSTTVLVEKEQGIWVLQISASLTAFQQEIRTHFTETPYETPEEFQQRILEHIKNNLEIRFNDDDTMVLGRGMVKLGHETMVVFEVLGIPSDIESVRIKNTVFKDIGRNQNGFMLFKKGFSKDQFVLNSSNDHTLVLEASGNTFIKVSPSKASFFSPYFGLLTIGILGIGSIFFYLKRNKRPALKAVD